MAVCLTKPTDVRKITPVHLFDEVYLSNEVYAKEYQHLAEFLYSTLLKVIEEDLHNLDIIPILFELPDEEDVSEENLEVRNNRVVYIEVDNPLFDTEKVYTSKLLDSLQSLLEYLEQPTASFNGLCNCLRTAWVADENYYYHAFCEFLADIKHGDAHHIEEVLQGEASYCYVNLICGCSDSDSEMDLFLSQVNTQLFSKLYDLLTRETSIQIHPLFLFACKNFCIDKHVDDGDWTLAQSRASLRAYGRSLEEVSLPQPKKIPKFFLGVEMCSDIIPYICVMEMLASLIVTMLACLAGSLFACLYIIWFVLSVASLISIKMVPFIVDNLYDQNHMLERHVGLRYYLQTNKTIKYALPAKILQAEPKVVREMFME